MIRIFSDGELAGLARRLCLEFGLGIWAEQAAVYNTVLALGVANRAAYWFDVASAQPLEGAPLAWPEGTSDVTVAPNRATAGTLFDECALLFNHCHTSSGLTFLPNPVKTTWIGYLLRLTPGRHI